MAVDPNGLLNLVKLVGGLLFALTVLLGVVKPTLQQLLLALPEATRNPKSKRDEPAVSGDETLLLADSPPQIEREEEREETAETAETADRESAQHAKSTEEAPAPGVEDVRNAEGTATRSLNREESAVTAAKAAKLSDQRQLNLERVRDVLQKDPKRTVQVMKIWLTEDGN
ncbi:hypothetical protein [Thiobaca trueperi]|uniref:Flagellar M-ring protein FliF n=1 Tax=Thiobaca trueperi TaxID=127458 RepID=A0A4R3MZF2_9GAMM|nr:hypothetical protein [Thiobaca trueperi]TCT21237.1 hypothetical protein EDC35_10492 [Thiobaca trueperi]